MTDRSHKGSYDRGRLSVSRTYLRPRSRKLMTWIGLAGAAAFAGYFLFSLLLGSGEFASGGPLSSAHATFDEDCSACHRTLVQKARAASPGTGGVEDANCTSCHGGPGETIGTYSFPRHYIYASGDSAGLAEATAGHREIPCAACHPEHEGRRASIIDVPDHRCLPCHDYGSFESGHPQFDFAAESIPDDSTLVFTHVRHTREVQKAFSMSRPCGYCHRPAPDGRSFDPIRFEDHCQYCHLNGSQGTGSFPVRDPADPASVGAETLEMIQESGDPGTRWAHLANPNEYKEVAGRVRKIVVAHRDPWILENLRRIRARLYPGLGIAGVLDTYGLASNESPRVLYLEAAAALEDQADGLSARGELGVKQDLNRIRGFLNDTRALLEREDVFPSPGPFTAPYPDGSLSPEARAELFAFADTLAHLCRVCHTLGHAAIARVKKNQSTLVRSRFDHAPHLLDGECLDCHAAIPLDPVEVAEFDPQTFDRSRDRAAIQNLPGIENCRSCHSSDGAASDCITCHVFHPAGTGPARLP